MARGRKSGPSRMDLRRQAEAAEARDKDEDEVEGDDDEEGDEDDEADETEEGDEEAVADEDEEEVAPKPKKAPAKKAPAKRSRTKEAPRMKAIWVVFDNAGKRVKEFPYPQKADAEKLLAEKIEEKKTTFYIQLVKEPMES